MSRARPPKPVNMHDAKTRFSKLVARVEKGEEITIARAGKPVAKLVPVESRRTPRQPGSGKGLIIHMADDFNQTHEDILQDFGV